MRINHNLASLNTYRQLSANSANGARSLEKLSSGLRINKAGDDAAGLAISEKMRGQIRGLDQASRNGQDAISLIQTAEGALSETHSILQRMRELATQSANDTNTDTDRTEIQKEINQLTSEINRIGNSTEFNTKKLLNGSIGANVAAKILKAGSAVMSASLTDLTVDQQATLGAGKYKLEISNAGGVGNMYQNISSNQNRGTTGTHTTVDELTNGADVNLNEGSYQVKVEKQVVKDTEGLGSAVATDGKNDVGVSVFNTTGNNVPITIMNDSTLAVANDYYVKVDKTIDRTIDVGLATGGLTVGAADMAADGNGDSLVEGNYQISVKAALTTADGATDNDLITDNVLKNFTIEADSDYDDQAKNYKITLTSDTPAADVTAVNAESTFTIKLNDGTTDIASASFSVSADSGSKTIKLGDVTFDVDLGKIWADQVLAGNNTDVSYDAGEVNIALQHEVSIKQVETGAVVTKTVADADATDWTDEVFDFSTDAVNVGQGKMKLDLDNSAVVRGSTYDVHVKWTDKYAVGLYNSANALQGAAVNFDEDQIAVADNITNISLGAAGAKVQVDLTSPGLTGMTEAETVKMDFDVTSTNKLTATLLDAAGGAVAGSAAVAVNLSGAAGATVSTDLGNDVRLTYINNEIDQGTINFTVVNVIPEDDFSITLKKDADSNGTYETTVVDSQKFDANDDISVGNTGVHIKAGTNVADGNSATFEVEVDSQGADNALTMQIGANTGQYMSVDVNDMRSKALEVSSLSGSGTKAVVDSQGNTVQAHYRASKEVTNGTSNASEEYSLDVSTSAEDASAAIKVIDLAISAVSAERSKLGAFQNRLDHTINNLGTSAENLTAAESRIRDVDMAKEMMEFTKNNILSQAAQAMLAQANQQPQGVLQLLR